MLKSGREFPDRFFNLKQFELFNIRSSLFTINNICGILYYEVI